MTFSWTGRRPGRPRRQGQELAHRSAEIGQDALKYDHEDDLDNAAYAATWATLYYSIALDAAHFGSLPEVDDDPATEGQANERP